MTNPAVQVRAGDHRRRRLKVGLRFTTPAFLGDAFQQARWRTPPLKWLLRRWWRIVHAPEVNYDVDKLRRDEATLFGTATDDSSKDDSSRSTESGSRQSQIRLALSDWSPGKIKSWSANVPRMKVGRYSVSPALYLGYGPLALDKDRDSSGVRLAADRRPKPATAIAPGEKPVDLMVTCPGADAGEIEKALQMVAWFGTVGSRSRNGWGSLNVSGDNIVSSIALLDKGGCTELSALLRPLSDCLTLDWPHAVGSDSQGRPLLWVTGEEKKWELIVKSLGGIKAALVDKLEGSKNSVGSRHVFNYPVTGKELRDWPGQRMANQLCFKVVETQGGVRGFVYHLPCAVPKTLKGRLSNKGRLDALQEKTWRTVHSVLDGLRGLSRLGGSLR